MVEKKIVFIIFIKKRLLLSRYWYLVIVVLSLLSLGFYISLKRYLSSEKFRSHIETNLALSLSGKAKLANLDWQRWKVASSNVSVTQAKGVIKSLEVVQLSSQLSPSSFLSKSLKLKHTEIEKVHLSIGSADEDYIPHQFPEPKGFSRLFPEDLWLSTLEVHKLNVDLSLNLVLGTYSFRDLSYSGSQKSKTLYDGTLSGGLINLPFSFLPKLNLEQGGFALSENAIEFYNTEVNLFDQVPATIQLIYNWEQSKLSLQSDIKGIHIKDLIANTTITGISGQADLNLKYKWNKEEGQSYHSDIILSDSLISHPLALNLITKYSNNKDAIALDVAKIEVLSPHKDQHTIHAYLEQKDRMIIEAHLTINDTKSVKGSILIGFNESQCARYSGKLSSVLRLGKKNLYWREIKVEDTFSNLKLLFLGELIRAKMGTFFSSKMPSTQGIIKSHISVTEKAVNVVDKQKVNVEVSAPAIPTISPKLQSP